MKRPMGWDKVFLTHLVIIGIPTIVFYYLRRQGMDLFWLHALVATVFLLNALMIIGETTVAMFRRFAGGSTPPSGLSDRMAQKMKRLLGVSGARLSGSSREMPRCTFIVPAFLPNEQNIIIETLEHLLTRVQRPAKGLEVILAYNTPVSLPVEKDLRRLASRHPALQLLHVQGSESKAQNLNSAIELASGEVIGILDADHHPAPDCLERAWRWLDQGYDVVQGRSLIRNHADNLQTRMIAVEFECMYGISHSARSLWVDTAIFGGANGYWKRDVLRKIGFDAHMMTEDIDASARALLQGYRLMNDRSIVSAELAPLDFRSFWFQRKRWAQGWLQVSLRHQKKFWTSRYLTIWQKLYWTYLLFYRELYPALSLQIFPILFSLLLYQGYIPWTAHWYLWLSAIITLFSGPYQTFAARKNACRKYRFRYWAFYALYVIFYVMLKNAISIVALYNQLRGHNNWIVTRREISEEIKEKSGLEEAGNI